MRLIYTSDGKYYRRWVNLIPSCFLPGSSQFLSGRRKAGVAWFILDLLCGMLVVAILVDPRSSFSISSMGPFEGCLSFLSLVIVVDGFRRPIPCLHFKGWTVFICIGVCVWLLPVLGIRQFLIQPFKIPTTTMQPTIMGNRQDSAGNKILGDHIFVNKLIYHFSTPRRGDVIVFKTKGIKSPYVRSNECYVKRLVGLPGETIGIEPPYIMVNGKKLVEPAIFKTISESQDGYGGYCLASSIKERYLASSSDKITLGPDEYLVLGDNSRNSLDGRFYGPIKKETIIGKAFYIYAPADRKRKIE